jgi:hypothetical protein
METTEDDQAWKGRLRCLTRICKVSALGQSVWITTSREMLQTGELGRMMHDDAVVGVTSNLTIFQKAISWATATTPS